MAVREPERENRADPRLDRAGVVPRADPQVLGDRRMSAAARQDENRRMRVRLALVALAMFGFGYALKGDVIFQQVIIKAYEVTTNDVLVAVQGGEHLQPGRRAGLHAEDADPDRSGAAAQSARQRDRVVND